MSRTGIDTAAQVISLAFFINAAATTALKDSEQSVDRNSDHHRRDDRVTMVAVECKDKEGRHACSK